ncbi:unnamed protein product [Polarella glacialis]|uniref:Uncharacterized protein n=1 Tax=Polarella glacialis TaxID=89957 RepID=A0A813DDU0_POLGL|nr:unnamed protein product [Polarella glacialis]
MNGCLLLFLAATAGAGLTVPVLQEVDSDLEEIVEVSWALPHRRLGVLGGEGEIPEQLEVEFRANGTDFRVALRRNRALLPSSARHTLHHPDGRVEEGPKFQPCFYIGEVLGDAAGAASFSTCGGQLTGLVLAHGKAITVDPSVHKVDPAEAHIRAGDGSSGARHRVRRVSDERFLDFQADVASYFHIVRNSSDSDTTRRLTGSAIKYVEVYAVNDNSRHTAFGGASGVVKLALHSTAVFNTVSTMYKAAPTNGASFPYAIQIVLVGMGTFVTADPYESALVYSGSETTVASLLEQFNFWAQTQLAAGSMMDNDNRVLLSGRDFDGSTVGYAGVGVMCLRSRSGSVNMCGNSDSAVSGCAATVAHEMGHNFGMRHDGGPCTSSGLIMEAASYGGTQAQFSSCSVSDATSWFAYIYTKQGTCLENRPSQVFGDPVCRNGFIEDGEDCDCGQSDCTSIDPCCDGSTCKFLAHDPPYECSDYAAPCCQSCMLVKASASFLCRAAASSCDLPEVCPGGTSACPLDEFVYPGRSCTLTEKGTTYSGLCSAGSCMSMSYTCGVDVNSMFDGTWDMSDTCQAYNDDCSTVVCHDGANSSDPAACGQYFSTHGVQMPVPEGTPCWFPSDPTEQRLGMCHMGKCTKPHSLAIVPRCGNGGIDFGEECDCGGSGGDSCCDCSTCKLKATSQCSGLEDCCDGSSCQFKSAGAVCRAALGTCDIQEVCSGSSGICRSDVGKPWGTACTASDGVSSTCYGKRCIDSFDDQCATLGIGRPKSHSGIGSGAPIDSDKHDCTGLMCCSSCDKKTGRYNVNGVLYTDPTLCDGCKRWMRSSTFTVAGISNKIYLGAAAEGSVLTDKSKICKDGAAVTPDSSASCSGSQFFEGSVGRCIACDTACSACTGLTNFDCTGSCAFGAADSRGACPVSAEQYSFATAGAIAPTVCTRMLVLSGLILVLVSYSILFCSRRRWLGPCVELAGNGKNEEDAEGSGSGDDAGDDDGDSGDVSSDASEQSDPEFYTVYR